MKPEPVTFLTGCAIERDYIYVAGKPDAFDSDEDFSRMYFYDAQDAETPWVHHDLPDWKVVSTCVVEKTADAPRKYAALSEHGEIEFTWPGGSSLESIEGAGLKRTSLPIYGYVSAIREIAGALYVCGSGGQVYRRENKSWRHIADSLKSPAAAPQPGDTEALKNFGQHDFADIAGYSDTDLYVVGGSGEIYHFNGKAWTRCASPSVELLNSVCCAEGNQVWVCGFNGTLLRGNAGNGFKDMSGYDDNQIFSSLALVNGIVYLASNEGLFSYNEKSAKIEAVSTLIEQDADDPNVLTARDGVLWSIGYKTIMFFDGNVWTRVNHPDNL